MRAATCRVANSRLARPLTRCPRARMSSPIAAGPPRRRSSSGAESAPNTPAAAAATRRRFYHDAAGQLGSGSMPLSSPYDFEISKLFAPALVAGLLEPVQMTAESMCVGRLGVPQLGALGLGTVLFQFAVGFFAPLIIGTTPRVAAAHVESRHLASKATAHGMWVALLTGAALQAAVWVKTPDIVAYMSGSDVAVASFAVLYLRARSWGLPAALVMMVAIGAARGVKDLNIPLLGSLAYLIGLVAFDVLLLFGPPAMGMEGAGYAASAAQWVGAATVVALLARKQIFDVRDMASLPGPADVAPYARMTAPLAVNNLSALLPTLVATSLATGLGVQHLGAHTILRQLMGFWLQLFLAFNATAHSLVANNLSRRAEGRAAEVLARLAQLAVALSIPVAAALFLGRGLLPDLFTEDVLVRHEVADVLPLLLLIMPLDALGTVLEGGILGASDTGYLGARTAASCGISLLVLVLSFFLHGSLLSIWIGMKAINVTALALDLARFLRQPEPEGAAKQAGAPAVPPAKERQE